MASFAPPRGMRDFYPEDYRAREAVFIAWRRAARMWGFEPYEAPVVETLELLERKAGEEISEQIYAFEDKGGNRLALRPELTPSLARMIIARQGGFSFPVKWTSIGQCFRYERMQRGRKREHFQWNLDVIGEESIMAEAEVIGAAIGALRQLGLTSEDFKVRVGSRALLADLLIPCEIEGQHFTACCMALDKRGKITNKEVVQLLEAEGLGRPDVERVFKLLGIRSLEQAEERLGAKDNPHLTDLRELLQLAEEFGWADFINFDLSVIRGLGYYTGIVFEAFDVAGEMRALFGGGRYDNLLSSLGGETMPCVGLGFGDVVVMELLANCKKTPRTNRTISLGVGFMEDSARPLAIRIATLAREVGWPCDLALRAEKPRKFFSRSDKGGVKYAICIGLDEVATGEFRIKQMAGGEPIRATLETLPKVLGA
jgi:histidyl-tRNA synthetase